MSLCNNQWKCRSGRRRISSDSTTRLAEYNSSQIVDVARETIHAVPSCERYRAWLPVSTTMKTGVLSIGTPTNKERLLAAYAPYNRQDSQTLLDLVSEDVDWPDSSRMTSKSRLSLPLNLYGP